MIKDIDNPLYPDMLGLDRFEEMDRSSNTTEDSFYPSREAYRP